MIIQEWDVIAGALIGIALLLVGFVAGYARGMCR